MRSQHAWSRGWLCGADSLLVAGKLQLFITSQVPRAKSQADFNRCIHILSKKHPLRIAEERKYRQYKLSAKATPLKAKA